MTEIEQDEPQEQVQLAYPPEAGISLSWLMRDRHGVAITCTMRGAHVSEWPAIIEQRSAFVGRALKGGWSMTGTDGDVRAPAAQPQHAPGTVVVREIEPGTGDTVAERVVIQAPAGGALTEPLDFDASEFQFTDCVRVVVRPEPENKTTIEFYQDGHKWADLRVQKRPRDRAAALMAHVVPTLNMGEAIDKLLRVRVYWREGKEYTKKDGGTDHYHDVYHVRQLA